MSPSVVLAEGLVETIQLMADPVINDFARCRAILHGDAVRDHAGEVPVRES